MVDENSRGAKHLRSDGLLRDLVPLKSIVEQTATRRDFLDLWIPMSDGTQIAARMWLPEDAEQQPVPATMECIPCRKRNVSSCSGIGT
jgi:predicted acyl esterase